MSVYYLSDNIPEIFKIADRAMAKKYPQEKYVTKPKVVPMPDIDSNPNVQGPLRVTEKWYVKKKRRQQINRLKDQTDCQKEMIRLLTRKEELRYKLGTLDISKKKDAKKIASINIELKYIDADIEMLEMQSGIKASELDRGSKLGRFVGKVKMITKKVSKKVKKFFKRHKEVVSAIASVLVPVLGGLIFKKSLGI